MAIVLLVPSAEQAAWQDFMLALEFTLQGGHSWLAPEGHLQPTMDEMRLRMPAGEPIGTGQSHGSSCVPAVPWCAPLCDEATGLNSGRRQFL